MPFDLTGIQNVGEFYSHHYLDALLEQDLKGLFARWREDDEATPDRRLSRCATDFFAAKSRALRERTPAERYTASHAIHVELAEALGYAYAFELRYLAGSVAIPVLGAVRRDGRDYIWLVETLFTGADEAPLEQNVLRGQYPRSEDEFAVPEQPWEALLGEIFRRDEPPRWIILFAGRLIYLIDRTKWGQGQYLLFDLDEIFGRRQSQTLRATAALLSREALCPDEGVPLHDTLDENSHKHAYGVSSDLKYGVRRAVELLANEYVWYQRNVGKQALFQDDALARKLTNEALTYLYRLLFLFYAEARGGELDVVPMKSDAYRTGYSLESLRDLEQSPLTTPQAQDGYFLNESLDRLFDLVNEGFQPSQMALMSDLAGEQTFHDYGFSLPGLHSPLFSRQGTPLLSGARFRNGVLQQVIQLLSLSRERRGRRATRGIRGRISYAQLGINQLGAVYEGLLSYTGFFAQETLVEVKPADAQDTNVDETAQTYFVPESEIARYEPDELVYAEGPDGSRVRRTHPRGSFIFRLAGRDREKLASYYTPEVLTRCVVKYSLKELLREKPADDILRLSVCEMALGSGAFVNEALNQLADAYLERKQKELGRRILPDDYRDERQKVKAHLALNNVYGVDLNPTAIELARVSIWLNIIYRNARAPWFGARLAVGNSLIGARRQVYSADDVKSGAYRDNPPSLVALDGGGAGGGGRIYHWLLPDAGMAAFDADKVIRELAPDQVKAIKDWRKKFTAKITAPELANLLALSARADELWAQVVRERQALIERTRETIPVWGQASSQSSRPLLSIADKEAELALFHRANGPFRRLRLAMDYWCALWFWPIPQAGQLSTRQQFLDDMAAIFAGDSGFEKPPEQLTLDAALAPTAPRQARLADVPTPSVDDLCEHNPRLKQAAELAERLHFHHWELTFAEVFAERGGFDLLLGNPPWVLLSFDEAGLLSDYDAQIAVRKLSASSTAELRSEMVEDTQIRQSYLEEYATQTGEKNYLGALVNFPLLAGVKTNLYKCFLSRAWETGSVQGIVGLLHPEGVYDDPSGGFFRSHIYLRLKSHFQFHNELKLFPEIGNTRKYSVNIYTTKPQDEVGFDHIVNLYHPTTVDHCFSHDGHGYVPSSRNEKDEWELRGHRSRIVRIARSRLALFASLYDGRGFPDDQATLPLMHSTEMVQVLDRFAGQALKLGDLSDRYYSTQFWNETNSQKDGTIRRETRYPSNIGEWILSGPHFYVATPFNKTPNEGCNSHRDYSEIDLSSISDGYLPRTNYVPACSLSEYRKRTPKWRGSEITSQYRHVHRAMLDQIGERTLINAIVPPRAGNIHAALSINFDSNLLLVEFSGLCSSIIYDSFVRNTGKPNMYEELAARLPIPQASAHVEFIVHRTLRLNCLTTHYAALWQELYTPAFNQDGWAKSDARLRPWSDLTPQWQRHVALRTPFERRQALVELDVLAALALNLTLDELLTIYRVQFPVLQKNERRLCFDQRGMEVPMKTIGGELGPDEGHEKFAEMVPPFTPVNREGDYREAWRYFEGKIKENP